MTQRPLSIAILACCGFAAASSALALGFGRIPESIVFGQALDLSVPLRLEPGENLSSACVQAELSVGEQRLPPSAIRLDLQRVGDDPEAMRVRIRSAVVVLEPLVAVRLSVGCSGAVTRQFVVFADPPRTGAEAAPVAMAESLPSAPLSALPAPMPAPLRSTTPGDPISPAPAKAARTELAGTKAGAAAAKPSRRAAAESTRKGSPVRLARQAPAPRPIEPATPRLKLEEPEELLKAATLAVAANDAALASATQAAGAAQAAASAAEARLVALEKSLQDMHAQAASQRAAMEQMRLRLGQAEERNGLMWAMAALVLGLAACALWLGLRLRALQRERQAAWWQGAAAPVAAADADADASVIPAGDTKPQPAHVPASAPLALASALTGADAQADAQADVQAHAAQDLPAGHATQAARVEDTLTRAISVDELIDLEQQADFFVVLGQDDAAIDLLMAHLRSTGGTSPLPYLKLLEIYRRRQDREAYERMRKRFNLRFNAVAPDWQANPEHGRELQDYPGVVAQLQAAWPLPLDAMAELENLLFRKSSGELFELPAYRDVLTLFAVARDLHRLADHVGADVDVLLPLMSGQEMAATVPQSIFDRLDSMADRADRAAGATVEDRPTAPVDLDLSDLGPVSAALRRIY